MESDLLWNNIYNTPEDDYREYRRLWMRVCANISQIGKPVVLCGCAVPDQFENAPERIMFSEIHYIAIVCGEDELKKRMQNGRGVTDENWIKNSVDFNKWLIENSKKTNPEIFLLDITILSPEEAASAMNRRIMSFL